MFPSHCVRGFTIFELLLAVSIIGILAVIAVPQFTTLLQNHRLEVAAQELYERLQTAKSEAVKVNNNIYVTFNQGSSWCYGVNQGSSCDCTIANNCGMGVVSNTDVTGLQLSATGLTSNSVIFDGTHGASSATASVTFESTGDVGLITLSVSRLGIVTFCASNLSGYTSC